MYIKLCMYAYMYIYTPMQTYTHTIVMLEITPLLNSQNIYFPIIFILLKIACFQIQNDYLLHLNKDYSPCMLT